MIDEAPVKKFGMGSVSPQFKNKPIAIQARTLDNILTEQGIQPVYIKTDLYVFNVTKNFST
jgi:hypothetical protein